MATHFLCLLGLIPYSRITQADHTPSEETLLRIRDGDGDIGGCGEQECDLCDSKQSLWLWKALAIISSGLVVLLLAILSSLGPSTQKCRCGSSSSSSTNNNNDIPAIYSPAESAVEYETVVFRPNFYEDHLPYAGPPSESVDEMWEGLYGGITDVWIDGSTAGLLPNATLPIPGVEDRYVIGIEVFHQLHCLNTMRKAIYPEYYKSKEGLTPAEVSKYEIHLEHCIEVLRQTVQCYADTTAIPWAWEERRHLALPTSHTVHVCRRFEALQDWARQRAFRVGEYAARLAALREGRAWEESGA